MDAGLSGVEPETDARLAVRGATAVFPPEADVAGGDAPYSRGSARDAGWVAQSGKSAENGGGREMRANALPGGVKTLKPTDS